MRFTGILGIVLLLLPACAQLPERDAAMRAVWKDAAREATRLRTEPKPLTRPVVVLGGYRAPPFHASGLAAGLVQLTSGRSADVLVLSFPLSSDLDSMAARVIRAVEDRWPSEDPDRTIGVDVVGISMGGVLARWAAVPAERRHRAGTQDADRGPTPVSAKRLNITRLFTLASPHQGAIRADWIAPDRAARDMRRGSAFLRTLDAEWPRADYELVCYTQRRDTIVGAARSAPPGHTPIQTSGTLLFSHLSATSNRVFWVDIARRLRDEPPLVSVSERPSEPAAVRAGPTAASSSAPAGF